MNGERLSPEHQKIFDSVPPELPKSRLEPYRSLILLWRRQGRPLRKIKELLAEKFGVQVSIVMVGKFIKSRSRGKAAAPPEPTAYEKPIFTPKERAAVRDAILSTQQQTGPEREAKKLFVFDPDKPLVNRSYES